MGSDDIFGSHSHDEKQSSEPAEELRYEGPITFDDDEFDDDFDDSGGSKVFITTVAIAALVVIIVAVAIWLSRDRTPAADALAELGATRPAAVANETPLSDAAEEAPSQATGTAAPEESAALDYRAVPESSGPAPERAIPSDAEYDTESKTPTKTFAGHTTPAKDRSSTGRPSLVSPPSLPEPEVARLSEVSRLALAGQVWEAAQLGQRVAPGADRDWTLQVLFACQSETVTRAYNKGDDGRLIVYPASSRGRSCFRLCWGTFPDRSAAEAAVRNVPVYFLDAGKPHPIINVKAR